MSEGEEAPGIVWLKGRIAVMEAQQAEPGTIDALRLGWMRKHLEDAEVGYTTGEAVQEVMESVSFENTRRLAAMVIRFFDSPWSDAERDLLRGVEDVLGRESKREDA